MKITHVELSLDDLRAEKAESFTNGKADGITIGIHQGIKQANEKFADILTDFYCDKKNQTKCQECLRRIGRIAELEKLLDSVIEEKIQRGEMGYTE